MTAKPRIPAVSLVVTDLDNTLYDWVTFFVESIYAMVAVAARHLGVSEDRLLDELQAVHRANHNSEHPFALLQTQTVLERFPGRSSRELKLLLDPALHAFNSRRRQTLRLYPEVAPTLHRIRASGVRVVGHTEATVPNALFRLRALGLEQLLTALYAPSGAEDEHPEPERLDRYHSTPLRIRHLAADERKPDPRVLLDICRDMNVEPARTLYIGDSIARDIAMARLAGTYSAWAEYGTKYDSYQWSKLVRLSHWTSEDVERARLTQQQFGSTPPDVKLSRDIGEIFAHFSFEL